MANQTFIRTSLTTFAFACFGLCQAQTFGNTSPFAITSSHSPDYVLGVQVTIPTALKLQSFGMIYGLPGSVPASAHGIFGLYSSSPTGGLPLNLVAKTGAVLLNSAQNYDNIAFNSTPTISAGIYWMMAIYDVTANPRMDITDPTSKVAFWSTPYSGGMSASAPSTINTYTGQNFNYWVNGAPAVPEPASLTVLGLGALAAARRRFKKS